MEQAKHDYCHHLCVLTAVSSLYLAIRLDGCVPAGEDASDVKVREWIYRVALIAIVVYLAHLLLEGTSKEKYGEILYKLTTLILLGLNLSYLSKVNLSSCSPVKTVGSTTGLQTVGDAVYVLSLLSLVSISGALLKHVASSHVAKLVQ